MTSEIPISDWGIFLDDLTKRRFGWRTKVEVFNEEFGYQILDENLPLNGITCERDDGDTLIEVFIGSDDNRHQTHTIKNPVNVAYLGDRDKAGGIVEFEEADGTKTLVHVLEPMPIFIDYARRGETRAA